MPSSTSNPHTATTTTYKASLDGEIRRLTLAIPISSSPSGANTSAVDTLQQQISMTFCKHVVSLSWTDEDGDKISLKTDLDLVEAIRAANQQGGGVVKLTVTSKPLPCLTTWNVKQQQQQQQPKVAPKKVVVTTMPSTSTVATTKQQQQQKQQQKPAMPNFSASSSSIALSSNGVLSASCRDSRGHLQAATLDLNNHVGNKNGKIDLDGGNFSKSARSLKLANNSNGCTATLISMELRTIGGQWVGATLDLDSIIENQNGRLVYVNTTIATGGTLFTRWKGKSPATSPKGTKKVSAAAAAARAVHDRVKLGFHRASTARAAAAPMICTLSKAAITKASAAAAPAPAPAVHRRVVCDKSGMRPIRGPRYHLVGANYDLCHAEFNKLAEDEKLNYAIIAKPGSTPVPYASTSTPTTVAPPAAAAPPASAAAPAPAVAAPAPSASRVQGAVLHYGVICDISGESPIVGTRYQMRGYDYDLCEAEFNKLDEEDKINYVMIASPSDVAVPYQMEGTTIKPAADADNTNTAAVAAGTGTAAAAAATTTTAVAPAGGTKVIRAWYGHPNDAADWQSSAFRETAVNGADVTAVVQKMVSAMPGHQSTISVRNGALGCDPCPGVRKILLVEYIDGTVQKVANAWENEICVF